MKTAGLKRRVYDIMQPSDDSPFAAQFFVVFIMTLIVLNVLAVILETVGDMASRYGWYFEVFNAFSVIVFTIEYALRVWSCTAESEYSSPFWGRLKFMLTPLALIDLIVIVPFYLPFVANTDLRVLRAFRLIRIFKMTRYSYEFRLFFDVILAKKRELVISASLVLSLLVISSSLMYYAEGPIQPEKFSSIPATMWWAVVTVTTLGYGDALPVTYIGKLLAGVVAVIGISLFAIPAAILASGFIEHIQKTHVKKPHVCPHCGKPIDD